MSSWDRFKKYYLKHPKFDFSIDISKVAFNESWLKNFDKKFKVAMKDMKSLEKGAIANPDENRMVGHYWLRKPALSPNPQIKRAIEQSRKAVRNFSQRVLSGKVKGQKGQFTHLLVIGIGGSALGPQFIDQALRPAKGLQAHFIDNTDPDGIDRLLNDLKPALGRLLVVVISKSGGTKETRNGMLEVQNYFKKYKLDFSKQAVAVTGEGSLLYDLAKTENWLETFPMWDWVGGRTSVMSAVGLLPMSLCGYDTDAFLAGAAEMDEWTRTPVLKKNPAGLLSAMWYRCGLGKGIKDMVILPYKDRLELFSKYLQQLVMESLGKKRDLRGKLVHQGIAVYGNKGSTDQHAYIQQLRDGLNNFFVTFIEVKTARGGKSLKVEPGATTGDFLEGFYLGTRSALTESKRENLSLTIDDVNSRSIGRMIALFERAVSFYASYVNINAYHQPGVEAGKKAAGEILDLKLAIQEELKHCKKTMTAAELSRQMKKSGQCENIFKLLDYLSANSDSGIKKVGKDLGVESKFKAT